MSSRRREPRHATSDPVPAPAAADRALLDRLVELAGDAGLEVRVLSGRSDPDLPARSGVCRLRGRLLLVLVPGDALEDRIAVVAEAIVRHRPELLDERYLPPALRARLEAVRT